MQNKAEAYWKKWQKLIKAAANFQRLLSGSVLIGGSAVSLHLGHRYPFDADHILADLRDRYEEVLNFLKVSVMRRSARPKTFREMKEC